jgi:hypothetical protein
MHTEFWSENPNERALGRPRHGWEDNTRLYLREIGEFVD